MNRIYKTFIALSALVAVSSCYKEPEFEFAQKGPDMTITCDESALMGGKIDFTANLTDEQYPLSTIIAQLYWDLELGNPVSEVVVRTKSEGTYLGSLPVPFEKLLPDGIAAVVFKATNTHLGVTYDTTYVSVTRPKFESLTLASGDSWRKSLTPVEGEEYEYSYTGNIPSDFEAYITTPAIAGKGTEITFGWNGREIVPGGTSPIPFDIAKKGTITFNTRTFEGSPFVNIWINGSKAEPTPQGTFKALVKMTKGDKVEAVGVEDWIYWYRDPDHFILKDGAICFNAVDGHYTFEMNTEHKFVTVRRAKEDGSAATYADEGAITFMGWGVAHPVMTNQFAWDTGALVTLAEIEDGVYQFSGRAVDEKDGTTLGGAWRYDYLSFKFFGQAGWGAEYGTVTLTERAKEYLAVPGNVELASGVQLELGAEYVMQVTDCTPLDANNKFNCTIDFWKK